MEKPLQAPCHQRGLRSSVQPQPQLAKATQRVGSHDKLTPDGDAASSSESNTKGGGGWLGCRFATVVILGVTWIFGLGFVLLRSTPASASRWRLPASLRGTNATVLMAVTDPSTFTAEYFASQYECLGWRQTSDCIPSGPREIFNDEDCQKPIPSGASGFCELRHRATDQTKPVMRMHCDSLRKESSFSCDLFAEVMAFQAQATRYTHDTRFSYEANQRDLLSENRQQVNASSNLSFDRAIVMVVYEQLLASVYASVRTLRAMNCSLPVEIWYRDEEVSARNPILDDLVNSHGVFLREIKDLDATGFFTKLHAIFYSAFDQILFLDADNFAVKDPTFLFDLPQFTTTGAIFWPDYWQPESTIFNVHARSFVWELFELPFVDEFEQESGQLLVDRRQHFKALNMLMFYGFHTPRLFEETNVLWGDKDLFRFAWRKTNSSFYFVPFAPGSAGLMDDSNDEDVWFCGATIVQHDADNQPIFLHRNGAKFLADYHHGEHSSKVWTHVQQFALPPDQFRKFRVYGVGTGPHYRRVKACFGKARNYTPEFVVRPIQDFAFADLEDKLMAFVEQAQDMLAIGWMAIIIVGGVLVAFCCFANALLTRFPVPKPSRPAKT